MEVLSKVYVDTDRVENKDKKATANSEYVQVYVIKSDGSSVPALFTDTDITKAITRAEKNKEDLRCESRGLMYIIKYIFGI